MKISAPFKDWERIAYCLHRLAAKELPRKKSERHRAEELGDLIADAVAQQRSQRQEGRHKWDRERLKELLEKGKTIEEIAEIEGVDPQKLKKALKRLNLLKPGTLSIVSFLSSLITCL